MKAIILNSGLGHRMGVITKEHPKCMTEISHRETILSRQLRQDMYDGGPHEANFLKLDCTKLKETFEWQPRWNIKETIDRILEFEIIRKLNASSNELAECMNKQIKEYVKTL